MPSFVFAQSNFSVQEYSQFLLDNQNLDSGAFLSRHAPQNTYYSGSGGGAPLGEFSYLDAVVTAYDLTESELDLLEKNHFVVTERLSFHCFGGALHDIYGKDLPVFVTTDAILHALHASYDRLLMDIEAEILEPGLAELLDALHSSFPQLLSKYESNPKLHEALGDVDLYVTVARSLLVDKQLSPQYISADKVDAVWGAILSEQLVEMPLFTKPERLRRLDFSQFTVRGHYTDQTALECGITSLRPYFKCMMWLGRMDFMLTPPPAPWEPPWQREEIRRMNLGAVLLNELVDMAGARSVLNGNDEIITFMVGESDNLTPAELADLVNAQGITGAADLLDDPTYDAFQEALTSSADYGQRILSNFFIMDPYSTEPDALPVSFRLMGQRFIIDSYIFSNVVYDRIIYEDRKIWRPMPDPLDAMFVLGNDDALPLLREELETYKYSSQLAALRFLVDAYDAEFWDMSLYNVWLQAIRLLNPPVDRTGFPFFMQTAAWQQEKLTTQLASWAQLRHDNLLYAKQSYTGGTVCSFPHSFVEPYPAFYRQIAAFAEKAGLYFAEFPSGSWVMSRIRDYFPRLKNIMSKLERIAQKELDRQALSDEEVMFLRKMLFIEGGSGAPPFSGWYADLFYMPEDAAKEDYVVADVHTQPTDESGNVVGRVLHVGVGNVNLGVFLADAPSNEYQPMAFVGPVMSYYEKITEHFDRLTDERWTAFVESGELPARPDWVNIYLADSKGYAMEKGRELFGVLYTEVAVEHETCPEAFRLSQNHPNPFNACTTIYYALPGSENVILTVYDILGQKIETLVKGEQSAGLYSIRWHARDGSSGLYFCRIQAGAHDQTIKMMLLR
jgi:hypothetical protein